MTPRMDPVEIEYFEQLMKNKLPGTKMVEWGSGGSTVMFVPHFETGELYSIEHNEEWFNKVSKELNSGKYPEKALANFTYCMVEPSYKGNPVDKRFYGYGVPFEENPCFARYYINPALPIWDADIFFVDGICRGAILATIHAKFTKASPQVYIHDYYGPEEREGWYDWATSLYSKVEKIGTTLARLTI